MAAEGEKKGATATAEEGTKMVEKQGEKGVVVASEAEEGKTETVEGQGEKAVAVSEAEEGKMVEALGEMAVADSEAAEKGNMVAEHGEKAVEASKAAEKGKMVVEHGEKEVVTSEAETVGMFITVKSSDGKALSVSKAAAELSGLLREMIQATVTDDDPDLELPNDPKVDGSTLATVFEYCNKHAAAAATKPDYSDPTAAGSTSAGVVVSAAASEDLKAWDRAFLDGLTMDALYDLLVASSFLEIPDLLDAVAHKAADMIKGKTTEQIRETFNIVNDLTQEQEAEAAKLSQKNVWDFDA